MALRDFVNQLANAERERVSGIFPAQLFLTISDRDSICSKVISSAHEIFVLITYAQKHLLNAHADISIGVGGQNFGLSHRPHIF